MDRRTDLYNLKDLTRPCVGEFQGLDDIKLFYERGGAIMAPGTPHSPTVSQCYRLYQAKKQDVDLVEILKAAYDDRGVDLKWRYQKRGTCVGQSGATAVDMVMAVAWLVFDKKIPGRTAVCTGYAGSRVEVAGQPGGWDGSNCNWIAEFMTKWGVAILPEIGLGEQELDADERLAVQWAASRAGVPEKFELITKERPIVRAPQVTTSEELVAAIESGNPVITGSNLIPSDRDTDDTVPVKRSGGHAITFGGIRWRKDGSYDILYVNSWSDSWGRNGCVWITSSDAMRIINQNDSFAYVGIGGLEPIKPL